MDTEGLLAPETPAAARRAYAELGPAARTVTRATLRALELDEEAHDGRRAAATARDALFGSLLEVHVGTREEFADWREGFDGRVQRLGSENVPNAVWHVVPFGLPGALPDGPGDAGSADGTDTDAGGDESAPGAPGADADTDPDPPAHPDEEPDPLVVVATYQDERDAAVATLRRTVFGRVYREVVHADPVETGAYSATDPDAEEDA